MKTVVITIPEDITTTIQALQFEVESRKDLLAHMVNTGIDITSETFRAYEKEYQEFFVKYNLAKEDLQNNHLRSAVEGRLVSWNLDFASNEVTCNYEA